MWSFLNIFSGSRNHHQAELSANATVIGNDQLLALIGQGEENLILFDLRGSAEVQRFPFIIPGALLTTRVSLLELADWIPPRAVVVLYGAGQISSHAEFIERLPLDAHFYLLDGGVKSWCQARFPMEPVNDVFVAEAPTVWSRDFDRTQMDEAGDS